jgi:hypothetical protein
VVFAWVLRDEARRLGRSAWPAWLSVCMAVSVAAVGIFSSPHPLHNLFGPTELIGFQAPLALAIAWRGEPRARSLVMLSWVLAAVMWVTIGFNFAVFDRDSALWALERPVYGLVQRALFLPWLLWVAGAGALLARRQPV